MFMTEIHHELMAYYQGTYGTYNNELYYIEDIIMPEGDGYDEYEAQQVYENDGNHDVMTSMHLFDAYAIKQQRNADISTGGDGGELSMGDIDFSFPNSGLVNVPLNYDMNGREVSFNVARHVTRRARRQWRRALRYDSLVVHQPNPSIKSMFESITGQHNTELTNRITNNTMHSLFFPEYVTVDHALLELSAMIGMYALSPEWWIGQGKHGLIFGHNENICGKVTDDGLFEIHPELEFLRESFNEVIGERYAA